MRALVRLVSRLVANRSIGPALVIGLAVFFAMIATVPVYTAVASERILDGLEAEADTDARPQFSYFLSANRDDDPRRWGDFVAVDDYLLSEAVDDLNIELASTHSRVRSRRFGLTVLAADGSEVAPTPTEDGVGDPAPTQVTIASIRNVEQLISFESGGLYSATGTETDGALEVVISTRFSDSTGLTAGSRILLIDPTVSATDRTRRMAATVTGVWAPNDPDDRRWIVHPSNLERDILVSHQAMIGTVDAERPPAIEQVQWYLVGSARGVTARRVPAILDGQRAVEDRSAELFGSTRLLRGPDELLAEFEIRSAELRSTLTAYAVPGALVVALFILMVMGFDVERRRTELAVMHSRGNPLRHTIASIGGELVALSVLAMAAGTVLSFVFVAMMTRVRAFLDLGRAEGGPSFWQPAEVPFQVLTACAVALVAIHLLWLTGPARRTIVARRASTGRLAGAAKGVAANADLAVVAAMGALLIQRADGFGTLEATSTVGDGLDDPWLVAMPAAAGLAVGLILVRVVPYLATGAARLLERAPGTAGFLAAQRLAHSPRSFRGALLLIVITTSLAAFLASLSLHVERQLVDRTHGAVGADHAVVEIPPPGIAPTPIEIYRSDAGVVGATRTAELRARFNDRPGEDNELQLMAIDGVDFADAAHWQRDYADRSLGQLLTDLTAGVDRVLISRTLARRHDLAVGDRLPFAVAAGNSFVDGTLWLPTDGIVAGVVDRFPRWAGDDRRPLVVMNRSYLDAQIGSMGQSTTLLRQRDPTAVLDLEAGTFHASSAETISAVRTDPERQGIFGVLSATFIAATLVALLALVLQSLFSYRQRAIESGVLRAIGLGFGDLTLFVAFDFVIIGLLGVAVGTVTGIVTGQWLIPKLTAAGDAGAVDGAATEMAVDVAWQVTSMVVLLFVVVILALVATVTPLLRRLRIFQAIKLGETL